MADQPERPHRRSDVEVSHAGGAVTLKAPAAGVTLTPDEAQELAARLVDASARADGENPEENDWTRIPMQYIHVAAERMDYEVEGNGAVPPDTDEELAGAKFAEVHCWIRDQTARNAMHIAAGWIAEHGWAITEVIEQTAVERDDFTETEYLPYYEQALTDSEVFLYEIEDDKEGPSDAS